VPGAREFGRAPVRQQAPGPRQARGLVLGRASLSTLSMTSILDSISSRLDESRETSRYLIGLLIFLGLLGTFWGLLKTIIAVQDVIQGLSATSDTAALFGDLIAGLQAPLSGMGTAFSSSLFGLAGALILGFLDLQTGQAQNRFYNDLEEWLSSITRLSSGLHCWNRQRKVWISCSARFPGAKMAEHRPIRRCCPWLTGWRR